MLSEVKPYIRAVMRFWWPIVIGVGAAFSGFLEKILEFDFPTWVWISFPILGVSIAQFLAWRVQHSEVHRLRNSNRAAAALTELAQIRGELISLQNDPPGNEESVEAWFGRFIQLRKRVPSILRDNFGEHEAMLFDSVGRFEVFGLGDDPRDLPSSFLKWRGMLFRDCDWIDEFAKQQRGKSV